MLPNPEEASDGKTVEWKNVPAELE